MKIELRWKIISVLGLLILFSAFITYRALMPEIRSYILEKDRALLKNNLFAFRTVLERSYDYKNLIDNAPFLASDIGKALNARVTIIDIDGIVRGDTDVPANKLKVLENHSGRKEVALALKSGFGFSMRFSTSTRRDMLYMACPLLLRNSPKPCVLRLSIPISEIRGIENKLKGMVILAMFYSLIAAILAGLALAYLITKPLSLITRSAKRIAGGDFSKKVIITTNDETSDLAKAFNYMTDQINATVTSIVTEKARLEAVIASMVEGIILVKKDGTVFLANNPARKLFMIDGDVSAKTPLAIIRNGKIQDITRNILQDGKKLMSAELELHYPDILYVKVNAAPVIINGHVEGAVLVFHDITGLRKLERIRQDFVANVSHELRTPITNIKGYAETLLGGAINDKTNAQDFLRIIHEDAGRLAKLIEDILDLSKIESGKMKMVFLPSDIMEIIKRSKSVVENQAKEKGVSINALASTLLPKVMADEARLSQVIINLLDNAIKYSRQSASVHITAELDGKNVKVNITDTGEGIAPEDLTRIFERFYRADKSHSKDIAGTGLGLSIVKHIVQAHGGEVSATSVLGKGSTFSFTVPQA